MAFDAYDDYEQSERVQKWLRENGVSIAVGIAIGLVGIFGWQQWRNHQASSRAAAAAIYQQVQAAENVGNQAVADQLTEQLQKNYDKSSYAVFATSERARHLVETKQFDKAAASLDWAIGHAEEPALKSLMRLRMAQVQFAQGKDKEALATLDQLTDKQYAGIASELRGDVLVKLGRVDDARKSYQTALSAMSGDSPLRDALQLKIDDLAAAGKQGA
ncbi:YfgM family protein [Dyella lutea]|uniref:Ancillary SecYEG translocon subunit n=1 Tax=Dyella lutea TaxID=2950441 RepID=A0ABT1FD83_9GAMM|nr:tetratricopeptide repeat protein [Dyella lutea]MCP1375336.1 tetratricopeptide repeat protein [Dyella lutea]